jgi:hypothetical protein
MRMKAALSIALWLLVCCVIAALSVGLAVLIYLDKVLHCAGIACAIFQLIAVAALVSPLFVFPVGACLSRHAVYRLTESANVRGLIFILFGAFPLLPFLIWLALR